MENRFNKFATLFIFGLISTSTLADDSNGDIKIQSVQVVDPKTERREINSPAIDSERFEAGVYMGFLSVDGFNTNLLYGITGSYHINAKWLAQINYGTSNVDKNTYEDVVSGSFISDGDRDFEFFDVLAGYKLFPGRSYSGSNRKLDSNIILLAGFGQTSFAGEDNLSITFGTSYQLVLTDFMTCNVNFKDHIVDYELLGTSSLTHNLEFSIGVNALF